MLYHQMTIINERKINYSVDLITFRDNRIGSRYQQANEPLEALRLSRNVTKTKNNNVPCIRL